LRLVDNLPVASNEPAWWQRDDRIAAVLPSEEIFQGLRGCEAETVRRQAPASKTLDRCSEEALYFTVEIEKPIIEEVSQFCAYCGLADAADSVVVYIGPASQIHLIKPVQRLQ
jgi:hypothetical protein